MRYLLWLVAFMLSFLLPVSSLYAGPVVAVKHFKGKGSEPQMGRGLSTMVQTELVNSEELKRCNGNVVEWERRQEIIDEIKLQQKPEFDPNYRVNEGRLLDPNIFVEGSVTTTGTTMRWSIQLVDAVTGQPIGRHEGSVATNKAFEVPHEIAKSLAKQVCRRYPAHSSPAETRQGMDYTSPARSSGGSRFNTGSASAPASGSSKALDQVDGVVKSLKRLKGLF